MCSKGKHITIVNNMGKEVQKKLKKLVDFDRIVMDRFNVLKRVYTLIQINTHFSVHQMKKLHVIGGIKYE